MTAHSPDVVRIACDVPRENKHRAYSRARQRSSRNGLDDVDLGVRNRPTMPDHADEPRSDLAITPWKAAGSTIIVLDARSSAVVLER
jgi:hypothetical protein